jgi:Sulfotransferase domain
MRAMLWAHPRSRSTAFERAFIERGDCVVVHEPLSKAHYHGADPAPLLSALSDPLSLATSPLLADVRYTPPTSAHAVVKDMPSHAHYPDAHLASFTHHVVLVRRPAAAIRSYHAVDPAFAAADAGYVEVFALARRLAAAGAPLLVVEADDFAAAPTDTLTRVCRFLGISFSERMVRWEPRSAMPAWDMWAKFHHTALVSTTITTALPPIASGGAQQPLPPHCARLIAALEPVYLDILALGEATAEPLPPTPASAPRPCGLVEAASV